MAAAVLNARTAMPSAVYALLLEYACFQASDYLLAARKVLDSALGSTARHIAICEHYGASSERCHKSELELRRALLAAVQDVTPKVEDALQLFAAKHAIVPFMVYCRQFFEGHPLETAPHVADWKKVRGALFDTLDSIGPIVDSDLMQRATKIERKTNPLDGGRAFDLNLRWLLWQSIERGISLSELAEAMVATNLSPNPKRLRSHTKRVSKERERLAEAAKRYGLPVARKPLQSAQYSGS